MSTLALEPPPEAVIEETLTSKVLYSRAFQVLVVIAVWVVVWSLTKGRDTLALQGLDQTDLHKSMAGFRDDMIAGRSTNPVMRVTNGISDGFRSVFEMLQHLISTPAFPRPVPQVGWLGVAALATWGAWLIASWRIALLVAGCFVSFGAFGYWSDSMDLLIVTFLSVLIAVAIGMPLAVLIGTNRTAERVIAYVLDLMQTMPTFVYLIPVVLFFGIGVAGAVVCTLVYALPPIIRIAGHGIRTVSPTTIEATDSYGQTNWQRLAKVQLPMARKTIIVGLNQTTMAALSMAIIASYIDGPGLGKPVLQALIKGDFGGGFVPGLLIVVMAVMLDRTTTAASERSERVARGGPIPNARRLMVLGTGLAAVVAVVISRQQVSAATFPDTGWGPRLADGADTVMDGIISGIGGATEAFTNFITNVVLNRTQELLAGSPWWLSAAAILAIAWVLGGLKGLVPTVVCLAGIFYFDLWHDAMITLNMTLVATVLVMLLALVLGVWMARSKRADLLIRPILDAGQSIPAFVYLLPVLALFGITRFSAIVAAIIYAAPAAIKLVADGVKAVPGATLEAGRSTGSTRWQEITKVQLPMARESLILATNQGLLYVLAMAVIGGLVGAGALGYDVVQGVAKTNFWGKGMAAGITIVFLGIMLDRIARSSATREIKRDNPEKVGKAFRPFGTPS